MIEKVLVYLPTSAVESPGYDQLFQAQESDKINN